MATFPINTGVPRTPQQSPALEQLFKSPTAQQASPIVSPGNLILFNYMFWIHDPRPLVIVSHIRPGQKVWGININYLTFNYIKKLLSQAGMGGGFSYDMFKGDKYILDTAFRAYKWNGLQQIKKLDTNFVLSVMSLVRSFDPADVEIIRNEIREQILQQVNPRPEAQFAPEGQIVP